MAALLLDAPAGGALVDTAREAGPADLEEVYRCRTLCCAALSGAARPGAWKAVAPRPETGPPGSPVPPAQVVSSPARLAAGRELLGVEAEIAFRLGADLEARKRSSPSSCAKPGSPAGTARRCFGRSPISSRTRRSSWAPPPPPAPPSFPRAACRFHCNGSLLARAFVPPPQRMWSLSIRGRGGGMLSPPGCGGVLPLWRRAVVAWPFFGDGASALSLFRSAGGARVFGFFFFIKIKCWGGARQGLEEVDVHGAEGGRGGG